MSVSGPARPGSAQSITMILRGLYISDCVFDFDTVFTGEKVHSGYLDHSHICPVWGAVARSVSRVKGVKIGRLALT